MRIARRVASALIVLGLCGLAARPSLATDPADMQTWYANDSACSIFQVLVITDEQNPDDRVALVTFGGSTPSSYAKWVRDSNTLTLSEFQGRPHDTFTGTIDGNNLTAVHTWLPKKHGKMKSETCGFVLG